MESAALGHGKIAECLDIQCLFRVGVRKKQFYVAVGQHNVKFSSCLMAMDEKKQEGNDLRTETILK
jgi:hypothetical protein